MSQGWTFEIDTLQTYSIPKITPVVWRTWMVSVKLAETNGWYGQNPLHLRKQCVFTDRQLDNWMFGYLKCLGVGLRQTHVVQFIVALCLWRRMNTFERMKGQNRVIKSFHRTAIAWPGVGSCPERDLHCGAEFLQKTQFARRWIGCCHRAGAVLQVLDRSCLSGALQSSGPGQSFGDQQPRDTLEFGNVRDWSRWHQGGEPGVGSGFRRRRAGRLHKILQVLSTTDFFRLFWSTAPTLPW